VRAFQLGNVFTFKKPGCYEEVVRYFLDQNPPKISHASQIAVIGDRLFMDIMLANLMGSWAIWLQTGIRQGKDPVSKIVLSCLLSAKYP